MPYIVYYDPLLDEVVQSYVTSGLPPPSWYPPTEDLASMDAASQLGIIEMSLNEFPPDVRLVPIPPLPPPWGFPRP